MQEFGSCQLGVVSWELSVGSCQLGVVSFQFSDVVKVSKVLRVTPKP